MRYYPIFVNIAGKSCLVVGAGGVGRRKINTLHECGAKDILIVDPEPLNEEILDMLDLPGIRREKRSFQEEDLLGMSIVIASTSDENLNWKISRLCEEKGIFCNIVDQPEKCGFIVPAIFSQGDLTIAVSTGGVSPALSRKIRIELGNIFGTSYGNFLMFLGRLRPALLELQMGTETNRKIFNRIIYSDLLPLLENADLEAVIQRLHDILPEELHSKIEGFLYGLA